MRYRDEILTRFDGQGLRGLLAAHPEDVGELAVQDAGILEDLDYPADYSAPLATPQTDGPMARSCLDPFTWITLPSHAASRQLAGHNSFGK